MTNFVRIKTLGGIDYTIPILITETIGQLKLKIENVLGFISREQILNFDGRILNQNTDTICSYGIKNGDAINISFRLSKFNVTICLLDDRKFDFEVDLTDRIISLKSKLELVQELSIDEQVLLYKGNPLENNKSFLDSGISDSCAISLIPKLKETIHNLKKTIQKQIGFNCDRDRLGYVDKYLDDSKTNSGYHISENSVIKVVEAHSREVQILVKTIDGKTFDMVISKYDKIIDLKGKLQEKIKLKPDEQTMVFCGAFLCDDKTVDEYGICEKSIINVVPKIRNNSIVMLAKTRKGVTIRISALKIDKIIDVKKKIQNYINVDSEYLKLIFQGTVLENNKQVIEYGLSENSRIYIIETSK